MAAHVRTVDIPEADRRELQRRARSKGAPAREVERARIVLLAGDGVPGKQIAARVGRATSSAFHCATDARYSSFPPRVAALRRSSRETVDGARPIRPAICLTPTPCTLSSAISSRSANER
jgi:chloramphenicol 3-O-phosphotransferase